MQSTKELTQITVVAVPGPRLDCSNTKKFKSATMPVVETTMRLIVDMSAVQFVDSSGLGTILSFLRQVTARGGDLKVFGLSKAVRALFELVRMHKVIEIYNTKEEALAAFGP